MSLFLLASPSWSRLTRVEPGHQLEFGSHTAPWMKPALLVWKAFSQTSTIWFLFTLFYCSALFSLVWEVDGRGLKICIIKVNNTLFLITLCTESCWDVSWSFTQALCSCVLCLSETATCICVKTFIKKKDSQYSYADVMTEGFLPC